jgi:hypothetical protein
LLSLLDLPFPAPFVDFGVISSKEDRGHLETIVNGGSGELRKGEQLAVVAVPRQGVFLAEDAGNLPAEAIDEDAGGQGAVGEHIIPDGDLPGHFPVPEPLVDPLVMPGNED